MGDGLNPVAGAQTGPLSVGVQNGGHLHPAPGLRPHQHRIAAVAPLLGPVGHRGGETDGLAVQVPGRLEENRHVEGGPQKAAGQAGQDQQDAGPRLAFPLDGKPCNRCHQGQPPAQREEKGVQSAVDGEENSGGKGEGKGGQYAHILSPPPSFF